MKNVPLGSVAVGGVGRFFVGPGAVSRDIRPIGRRAAGRPGPAVKAASLAVDFADRSPSGALVAKIRRFKWQSGGIPDTATVGYVTIET